MTDTSGKKRLALLTTMLGASLFLLGAFVVTGWLLQVQQMVEIRAGLVAMTFNSALCFGLAGAALALPGILRRPMAMLQNIVGAMLILLGTLVLFEHLFDVDMGVDWAVLHTWLRDGDTRPGRFAPNTAIGFMLAGTCMVLRWRIAGRAGERAYQILMFCLMGVGLTGLIGYVSSPDLLFGWARSARMALHTALGMMVLAVALWTNWLQSQRAQRSRYFGLDERISFLSGAILSICILVAGLTGFVFQQSTLEGALHDKLRFRLQAQRTLIHAMIENARTKSEQVEHDPEFTGRAFLASREQAAPEAVALLQRELNDLIRSGFYSASITALEGSTLYLAGATAKLPDSWKFALPDIRGEEAILFWNDDVMLHTSIVLSKDKQPFAKLVLQQRLSDMMVQLKDLRGLGETGEIAVCGRNLGSIVCLPSGRNTQPYEVSRLNIAGVPLPISHALEGQDGLIATLDYRGNNVMAAYSPLAPNLGLVVKQNTIELYSRVRTQLAMVVPALILLLLAGVALMRAQIRPLAARLVASENQAKEQQQEMNILVGSVAEGIITINEAGVIESFNAAASRIFGYPPNEAIGQNIKILMPEDMRARHASGMRNYLDLRRSTIVGGENIELPGLRKDGSVFTLEMTVNEIAHGTRRTFVGVVRDISDRKLVEARLLHMAQFDMLTGLPNRALFMDRLTSTAVRAKRSGSAFAVLFLDLDGFKKVNDTMGHHSGDELLQKFGERLSELVRKSDTVARFGGDEFTIILEGLLHPQADACAVADKILTAMRVPFDLADGQATVTTSIGVAVETSGESNIEELLRHADDAMYRAKSSGKGCWKN